MSCVADCSHGRAGDGPKVRFQAAPISTLLPADTVRSGAFSFCEGSAGTKRTLMLSESVLDGADVLGSPQIELSIRRTSSESHLDWSSW